MMNKAKKILEIVDPINLVRIKDLIKDSSKKITIDDNGVLLIKGKYQALEIDLSKVSYMLR